MTKLSVAPSSGEMWQLNDYLLIVIIVTCDWDISIVQIEAIVDWSLAFFGLFS